MIAVTGANGLLGSFIIRHLLERQESFVAIKRQGSDISLLDDIGRKIEWRDADVLDPLMLSEALEGCTHVIHAAAIVSFNPYRAKEVMEINVVGTANVVNACLEKKIKRLVYVSSVAALGRQKGQTLLDENNKWTENSWNTIYASSKYNAELEVFRGQEEGLNTVIVNPSLILAPANWDRSSAQLFKYIKQEKPFYTDGCFNYADVRDVASCICQLLHLDHQAQRFIISAGKISYKDFFDKVAAQLNTRAPFLRLSKKILRIVSVLELFRCWFTKSEPLVTRETARWSGSHFLYDNQKIRNILKFEFQNIDETVKWCCVFYKKK